MSARFVFLVAGIACFFAHRPALAIMWLCYAIANICLLTTVLRK